MSTTNRGASKDERLAEYMDNLLSKQDSMVRVIFFTICKIAKSIEEKIDLDDIVHAMSKTPIVRKHGFWLIAPVEGNLYAAVKIAAAGISGNGLIEAVDTLCDSGFAAVDESHESTPGAEGWSRLGL